MSRAINKLTAREVRALKLPGRHSDGGGLYLRITQGGGRSWVFMATAAGKRVEIGLGPATSVSLAAARKISADMREAIATGSDPKIVMAAKAPETVVTFGDFAETFISAIEAGWKNPTHRKQWRTSLRDHAKAMLDTPVAQISTDDVLGVLQPIWLRLPETANRVRGRIERILAAAKARGLRPKDATNPAQLRGHLDVLLPKQSKLSRGHHAALPFRAAPQFISELRGRTALSARCLEFTILTAARSGEALAAAWEEIDFSDKRWTVPAERMKAGVEHVVPLSDAALQVLTDLRGDQQHPKGRIFAVNGAIRSNMAMSMLLKRMGYSNITVHGFRSTFRDWAGDVTTHPREIIESALAHTIQNKAERAYRRGTAVERRRALMNDWAGYLGNETLLG
ncbi:tyrosine-type recombinase/integrase [Sphingomonas sp.]|uniref:tyrosine-type recombinase/integrase n=1 Tax=Sphingomonas sp. TaxID=28214 RepID=UPI003B3A80BB